MYKNILIATDGSEIAQTAVEEGLELASKIGARATIVTVTEPWDAVILGESSLAFPINDYNKSQEETAAKILSDANAVAKKLDTACDTLHVINDAPAEGIVEAANKLDADLIVIGSHGRRAVARILLGSQANKVIALTTIPVLVCRPHDEDS